MRSVQNPRISVCLRRRLQPCHKKREMNAALAPEVVQFCLQRLFQHPLQPRPSRRSALTTTRHLDAQHPESPYFRLLRAAHAQPCYGSSAEKTSATLTRISVPATVSSGSITLSKPVAVYRRAFARLRIEAPDMLHSHRQIFVQLLTHARPTDPTLRSATPWMPTSTGIRSPCPISSAPTAASVSFAPANCRMPQNPVKSHVKPLSTQIRP